MIYPLYLLKKKKIAYTHYISRPSYACNLIEYFHTKSKPEIN